MGGGEQRRMESNKDLSSDLVPLAEGKASISAQ